MIKVLIIIAGLVHVDEEFDSFIGKVPFSVFGGIDASNLCTDNGTLAHIVVSNAMGTPVSRNWKGYWQRAA